MGGAHGARMTLTGAVIAAVTVAVLVLAPASAQAAWTSAEAHIVDPRGTGVVPLLNVSVSNHAENDASPVTSVQFSDDGREWYVAPYTGQPVDWVLIGGDGRKTLAVRFGAADGSVSEPVTTSVRVDTVGPVTQARFAVPAAAGRTAFRYVVRDAGSPRVGARLVVRGNGLVRRYPLGNVRTGVRSALLKLRLPAGAYRWHVSATDLAGRIQVRQTAGKLVVR